MACAELTSLMIPLSRLQISQISQFLREPGGGQRSQLFLHERQELLGCVGVTPFDLG